VPLLHQLADPISLRTPKHSVASRMLYPNSVIAWYKRNLARPGGRFQNSWVESNRCRTATVRADRRVSTDQFGPPKSVQRHL